MIFKVYYISGKDQEVFYVGATSNKLTFRLSGHKSEGKYSASINPEKDAKIVEHWDYLEINDIDEIEGTEADAIILENYWISQFKAWGFPLTNKIGLNGRRKKMCRREPVKKKNISINEQLHQMVIYASKKTGRFPYGYVEIAIMEKLERDGIPHDRQLKTA